MPAADGARDGEVGLSEEFPERGQGALDEFLLIDSPPKASTSDKSPAGDKRFQINTTRFKEWVKAVLRISDFQAVDVWYIDPEQRLCKYEKSVFCPHVVVYV